MILEQQYLDCLSQASYLIGDHNGGRAIVVDPRRDTALVLDRLATLHLELTHIVLTHHHADFAAGHLELQAATGAPIIMGKQAHPEFPFTAVSDGDTIELDNVRITFWETPGHTPEMINLVIHDLEKDPEQPYAVLTGDTLFNGDVGRPDLLVAAGHTADDLAGQLYESVQRLMTLPDATLVYPGHGAGSACGKSMAPETSTTIGIQRSTNYALQANSKQDFVALVTQGQRDPPRYFAHDVQLNQQKHILMDDAIELQMRPLTLDDVVEMQRTGVKVLDVRADEDYANCHMRGTYHISPQGRFAEWLGTLFSPDEPLSLITGPGVERDILIRMARVGFHNVEGYLKGGIGALTDGESLIDSFYRIDARRIAADGPPHDMHVLDVRTDSERAVNQLPGSLHIPLDQLPDRLGEVPIDKPVLVHCAAGYRSAIATSILRAHGRRDVTDIRGGMNGIQPTVDLTA